MPFRVRAVYMAAPCVLVASVAPIQPVAPASQPAAAAPFSMHPSATASASQLNSHTASSLAAVFPPAANISASAASSSSSPSPAAPLSPFPVVVVVKPAKRSDTGGFKHMLAGSVAGMASKTILQPLDLVKVRLQVQDGTGKNEYKGLRDGLRTILKADGFLGLYRGLAPNLMASGVSWGVYFFSYNHAKNFWRSHLLRTTPERAQQQAAAVGGPPLPPARLGPFAHLSCAAFSGTLATLFTNPFSMVKTRLQLQGKEVNANGRVYRGVFDAFTRIVREEGFGTLYRGIGPSLVLVSNGALQFMSYEELKRLTVQHLVASHEERELHAAHFLGMGALAKVFSATVTYPMAVTRARLYQRKPDELLKAIAQEPIVPTVSAAGAAAGTVSGPHSNIIMPTALPQPNRAVDAKYRGMADVIKKIWALEGWRGFYRGLTPMLIKTAPSSAMTFLIYESTIKLLHAEPIPKKKKFD